MADPINEPELLEISFLGERMATLGYRASDQTHALEFDPSFLAKGHDLSPFRLPIETMRTPQLYRSGDSPFDGGLPGLIADSLPDTWGARMLSVEVPSVRTILGKLAAIGNRGPGALTFAPVIGRGGDGASSANLQTLATEAAEIFKTTRPLTPSRVDKALAHGGSSLGGVFPKTTAYLPKSGEILQLSRVMIGGQPPPDHVPCILKFSGEIDEGGGAVEFAFMKMAAAAGIRVPRVMLVYDGVRRHFAVERFDRYVRSDGTVGRRHVHTLSGLLHRRAARHDNPDPLDYEDLMRVARNLAGPAGAEECLRRGIFNILSTNRDDHGRNHAFIYDEVTREWTFAPAYDLNPNVSTVLIALGWLHDLRVPTEFSAIERLGRLGGVSTRRARAIFGEVDEAIFGNWESLADDAGVPRATRTEWSKHMVSQSAPLRASFRARKTP